MALRKQLPILQQKICSKQHHIWKPPPSIPWNKVQPYIQTYKNEEKHESKILLPKKPEFPEQLIYCSKIDLDLTSTQEHILKRWAFAYAKMYNETLYFIKQMDKKKQLILNFKKLRTYHLKEIRDAIIRDSVSAEFGHHTQVKTHMLDCAIQLVCANYKSALSNYRAGNIRHFRIRYWRKKTQYRLDIEPSYISSNGICSKVLGQMKAYYNNESFDWTSITKTCQIHYDYEKNKFHLYVPFDRTTQKPMERKPWIALDPGVRTFLTGITEDEVLKIGDNLSPKFKKHLDRLDKTKSLPMALSRKRKLQEKLRDRIKHIADDLHWKVANFLVQNYETILIGDMSAKRVVRGRRKGLDTKVKRTLMALSMFKFRQRLAFKAEQYHAQVIEVNEAYTTRVCSCCGTLNKVGGNHVYRCFSCKHECDRDVDGARCIAIKGLF